MIPFLSLGCMLYLFTFLEIRYLKNVSPDGSDIDLGSLRLLVDGFAWLRLPRPWEISEYALVSLFLVLVQMGVSSLLFLSLAVILRGVWTMREYLLQPDEQ